MSASTTKVFATTLTINGKPVIVLGDSMTRGTLVNENETYTDLLDLWHPDMSFRNYGIGGYGQANSIRVYEEKGQQLDHQLVVQQFSLSTDLDDNVERAALDGDSVKINIEPVAGTPKDSVKSGSSGSFVFLEPQQDLPLVLLCWRLRPFFRIGMLGGTWTTPWR